MTGVRYDEAVAVWVWYFEGLGAEIGLECGDGDVGLIE